MIYWWDCLRFKPAMLGVSPPLSPSLLTSDLRNSQSACRAKCFSRTYSASGQDALWWGKVTPYFLGYDFLCRVHYFIIFSLRTYKKCECWHTFPCFSFCRKCLSVLLSLDFIEIFDRSQNNWSHIHHIHHCHHLPFWRAPCPSLCHPLIGIGGHQVGLRTRTLQCKTALLSLCVDEDILWRVGWQLKMKKWTEKQKLTKGELASLRGGAEGEAWDRKDLEK